MRKQQFDWRECLLAAVVFYGAATVSLVLFRQSGSFAMIWYANLATGILLASRSPSRWLSMLIGAGLANFIADYPFSQSVSKSLSFIPANLVELWLVALVARKALQYSPADQHSAKQLALYENPVLFLKNLSLICIAPAMVGGGVGAIMLAEPNLGALSRQWLAWLESSIFGSFSLAPICLYLLCYGFRDARKKLLTSHAMLVIGGYAAVTLLALVCLEHPYTYMTLALVAVAMASIPVVVAFCVFIGCFASPVLMAYRHYVQMEHLLLGSPWTFYIPMFLGMFAPMVLAVAMEGKARLAERLQGLMDFYQKLYQKTPVAMHSIDEIGKLLTVSDGWLKLMEYERSEVAGRSLLDFLTEGSAKYAKDVVLPELFSTGYCENIAYQMVAKSGRILDIRLSSIWSQEGDDHRGKSLAVLTDVSKEVRIEGILRAAIDSTQSGTALVEQNGLISYVNPQFTSWLTYSQKGALGSSWITLCENIADNSQRCLLTEKIYSLRDGVGESLSVETQFIQPHGRTRWGLVCASKIPCASGAPYPLFLQVIDIDLIKSLEADLELRNSELNRSNEELNRFAYVASHDLKSPLNAITKLASWIEEDCGSTLPEQSREHFELLKGRVHRLQKLLDDLLLYSRVGRIDYELDQVSLKQLSEDLFDLVNTREKMVLEVDDFNLVVPVTPFGLVLRNLVSNALKHHDKPQGTIQIRCRQLDNYYQIFVIDDGPGIKPSLHGKALEMFQTLKSRDEVEGSGMGLALCKKTVEHYEGALTIHSDGEHGTTIEVLWPLVENKKNNN